MRERCLFPSLLFRYSGAAAMINIEKAITTTKTANHSGSARYVIPGSGNAEIGKYVSAFRTPLQVYCCLYNT